MSTVDRGHARERQWMKRMEDEGYFSCRPRWAGVDVISMKDGEVYFDEVKANAGGKPYLNFRGPDRALLLEAATKAGARARLIYWPPGKDEEPRIIPSDHWP